MSITDGAVQETPIIDVHCGWGATGTAPQWNDLATIRTDLAARGVRHAFVSSLLARRYDLPAGNDALGGAIGSLADDGGVDLRGWLVIHPARLSESNTQMRRHLHSGQFIGAALYPDPISGALVSARDVHEVINSFRRFAKPLLVEARTADAMANVVELADSLGNIRVIASGMGGEEWREAVTLAARPLNLFLDISGSLAPEKIEFAIATLGGVRKLVFGSGAPYTDPAAVLGMLDDLSLSAEDRARILYSNAYRLFQLGPVSDAPISLAPMVGGDGESADSSPPPEPPSASPGLAPLQG